MTMTVTGLEHRRTADVGGRRRSEAVNRVHGDEITGPRARVGCLWLLEESGSSGAG